MQTMTVEVNNVSALKVLRGLSNKKQIRIIEETKNESPSLRGKPLSLAAFEKWIEAAESAETTTLQEAKNIWADKRKSLQKLIR